MANCGNLRIHQRPHTMGAAASLSPQESADAVSNARKEILAASSDNHSHAAMLAQHVIENFAGIEETAHRLLAQGSSARGLQMGHDLVAISEVLPASSADRVGCITALVTVLLVLRADQEETERWVNQAYSASAQQFSGSKEHVRVLMCYYALRMVQKSVYDAHWALQEIQRLLQENSEKEQGFSVKSLQYHMENILLLYTQAQCEDQAYAIQLQLHALLQEQQQPPSCPRPAVEETPSMSLNQVASSPELSVVPEDDSTVSLAANGGVNEGAGLLFELIAFCEAGDAGVDEAVKEALESCKGGEMYETMLAVNNHGDSLLLLAVKEKKAQVVQWLLQTVGRLR